MLTFTVAYRSQEAYSGPTLNTRTIQHSVYVPKSPDPLVPRDSLAVSTARLAAVNWTAASAAADGGDYVNAS
jgi:hypothetical protein